MKREIILRADVLDIIFEHRNKDYGAYELRKYYDRRLLKAVVLMICMVSLLSAFTLLPKKKDFATVNYDMGGPTLGHVKDPEKKIVPAVLLRKQPAVNHRYPFSSNIRIMPNTYKTDSVRTLQSSDAISTGNHTVVLTGGPSIETVPDVPAGPTGDLVVPEIKSVDKTTPVFTADVMPSFPGGMDALHTFLENNLHNPKDMEAGEQVNVNIRFVVSYDGRLQGFEVMQDGGAEFNREVIRVLKKMPEWKPGKASGQNVSVYYNIPVKFVPAE